MKKKNKRFYINKKGFTAVLLSLTLAFASVSSIQAEELNAEVLPEAGEEPPADTGEPTGGESTEGTEKGDEPVYVRTPDGAVILSAFAPLSAEMSEIMLEERETLAELTARMPKTLKAYAGTYILESPDEGDNPGDEDKKPEEGDKDPGNEDKKPEEGDKDPGNEDKKPEEGERDPGNEDKNPEDGNENPGGGQSGEAGNSAQDKRTDAEDNTVTQAAGREAWWHLFVASETKDIAEDGAENLDETKNPEEEAKNPEDEIKNPEEEAKNPEDEIKNPEDEAKTPEDDGQQPSEEPAIQPVEVEIPVTWECAGYEPEEQQGEQEEQKEEKCEYVFTPKWDNTLWFYDMTAEGAILPTITVRYEREEAKAEVSTQEELAAAFAAGLDKVVLKADIALTMTLMLPATAQIELDGEGHSLLRGAGEDGAPFLGTMIAMEGEGYTAETFGTLTLRNITIDGKTETDSAAAPAISDRGELILEEDAVVCNNDNYGTYPAEGEEEAETIFAYGGGIQVYGKLTLTEKSHVTGNYADELGGGVYLADGAALWLYADVIHENTVSSERGYGADLYAASGSTIYYDPSIDMTREGFYLCEGVTLIPMGEMALTANSAGASGKEIFLHVSKDSGYTDEQVEAIKAALREKGYTVLTDKRVDIDTTDLRDWYVYDHYDTDVTCWGAGTTDNPPQKWLDVYGGGKKRKFYPWKETQKKNVKNPVSTIEEWLKRLGDTIEDDNYMGDRRPLDGVEGIAPVLSSFKEHIYAREQDGYSAMTFVGYGQPAYVDFLFYDPESDGEKVVDFDVDSSDIFTHTMVGSGFLVNTGVDDQGLLSGYLVYYAYAGQKYPRDPTNTKARSVTIYKIDGVNADDLHGAKWDFYYNAKPTGFTEIVSKELTDWDDQMSIQIKVAPDRIEVRQQSKSESGDISKCEPVLNEKLSQKSVYSGFGPLVAYTSYGHVCMMASGFTFSNLRMYFTDAQEEQSDVMKSLERADFTQRDTQRYFINLLGNSEGQYNSGVNFGQYHEYLKLLQEEGVALVTDRDTPFDDYLGKANEPDSNLVEFSNGGGSGLLSVEELVEKIHEMLKDKNTTEMADKVGKPAEEGGVLAPEVHHSAGNIWLKSVTDGSQVRKLYGDAFGDGGYAVQIMDDITYYYGSRDEVSPVAYEVLKPGTSGYVSVASSGGGDAAPNSMGQTDDGIMITPAPFVVEKNQETWPAGTYVVRQTIKNGSICGYSFFDMVWGEQPPDPPVVPDTPIPDPPNPEEPEPEPTPEPPGPTPDPTPEPEPEPTPVPTPGPGPSLEEPPAEYTEETVTITAAEPMSPDAEPIQETEKKPGEPKTGDVPMPVLPVSVGACTAFVMKLRLWLYELETGIVEEKKNEMIRAIIAWAKNKNIIKVYLALAATAVVVTVFHLLKTVCGGKRQVVASFER